MNDWQVARQLKYLLKAQAWPGGTNKVFSDAIVSAGVDDEAYGNLPAPYAVVQPLDSRADPTNPLLWESGAFDVIVGVRVAGDMFGEYALIGNRLDVLTSDGRGLLEVQEELYKAIARLTGADGVSFALAYKSAVAAAKPIEDASYIAERTYRFEGTMSAKRSYHAPIDLAKSGTTLSWIMPPDRFDFWKVRLFVKSGSTAPTYEEAGATEVTIADPTSDTSVTHAHSGSNTYAIFAVYDETTDEGTLNDDRQSNAGASFPGTTLEVS